MRILTIQERIELGQAKNQATEILSQVWTRIVPSEREELYKKAVKQIYSWNKELDTEIMETGQEAKQTSSQATTPFEPQCKSQSPYNYPEHEKGKYGERR